MIGHTEKQGKMSDFAEPDALRFGTDLVGGAVLKSRYPWACFPVPTAQGTTLSWRPLRQAPWHLNPRQLNQNERAAQHQTRQALRPNMTRKRRDKKRRKKEQPDNQALPDWLTEEQRKLALDLLRRRGLLPWDRDIQRVRDTYVNEISAANAVEETPEWNQLTHEVQRAAGALMQALWDLKQSAPIRRNSAFINTYMMGVALADELGEAADHAQATGGFFFVPQHPSGSSEEVESCSYIITHQTHFEPLIRGIRSGLQVQTFLGTLAHGEHVLSGGWLVDGGSARRPDGVTIFNWACYQLAEILQKSREKGRVYEDLIMLLKWWEINDTKRPFDWQAKDHTSALRSRVGRVRSILKQSDVLPDQV